MWKQCLHSPITRRRRWSVADEQRGGSLTDWAVITRVLALGAGAFEVDPADATGPVGTLWQIPLPGGDCLVGSDLDLHGDGELRKLIRSE